jgi:hypothetical protein
MALTMSLWPSLEQKQVCKPKHGEIEAFTQMILKVLGSQKETFSSWNLTLKVGMLWRFESLGQELKE